MGKIIEQYISMKITVEPVSKVLVFNNRKCEVIPKYLYYLCTQLLEENHDVEDLPNWSIHIEGTFIPIERLKDMDDWD
jgi:hypothetical protein